MNGPAVLAGARVLAFLTSPERPDLTPEQRARAAEAVRARLDAARASAEPWTEDVRIRAALDYAGRLLGGPSADPEDQRNRQRLELFGAGLGVLEDHGISPEQAFVGALRRLDAWTAGRAPR